MEQKTPQDFSITKLKNTPQAEPMKQNAPQVRFLD